VGHPTTGKGNLGGHRGCRLTETGKHVGVANQRRWDAKKTTKKKRQTHASYMTCSKIWVTNATVCHNQKKGPNENRQKKDGVWKQGIQNRVMKGQGTGKMLG